MASSSIGRIKHVVVLVLENRSFDQMLGSFQQIYPQLDGIDPGSPPRINVDDGGNEYQQLPTRSRHTDPDPNHGLASVLSQIEAAPAIAGTDCREWLAIRLVKALGRIDIPWLLSLLWSKLRGRTPPIVAKMSKRYQGRFVAEYVKDHPATSRDQRLEIMGYYGIDALPALHELARHFTICDRWFSSVPGPTWANRFFIHTGTAYGITRMPESEEDFRRNFAFYDQTTIYDRLNSKGQSWRIYFHDTPQSLSLVHQWERQNRRRYALMDKFDEEVRGPEAGFPSYSVIEPQYMGDDANDDHPPHDIMLAQDLIARVYNGLRSNHDLWMSTLLAIVYDEHGGFYDHVEPPNTIAPDSCKAEYSFDRLGVRVPALLVSPWAKAGVFSQELDHTSIGKYLCELWGLKPLGKRMANATSIGHALHFDGPPNTNTPQTISATTKAAMPLMAAQAPIQRPDNENQIALDALSRFLDPQPGGPLKAAMQIRQADPNAARSRTLRFLDQ